MIPITLAETLLIIIGAGLIGGLSYWLGCKDGFNKGRDGCMRILSRKENS